MRSFFKIFFAALLALIVFLFISVFIVIGMVSSLAPGKKEVKVPNDAVLTVDLSEPLMEQPVYDPVTFLLKRKDFSVDGLNEWIRAIVSAADDPSIKGIYLELKGTSNGFATNEALRRALLDFRKSGKFIIAYGDVISQKDYYLATVANKIFLNPEGALDFHGFSSQMMFYKGALDKLGIETQVFYNGKFKSATEPFRTTQMTSANRLQTSVYIEGLYSHFLEGIQARRNIDTSLLREYANQGLIETAKDALEYSLVDGLKYRDEVEKNLKDRLQLSDKKEVNYLTTDDYVSSYPFLPKQKSNKVAILYAQGDIVDRSSPGGTQNEISAEAYEKLFSEIRKDSSIKAVVFRVNSPGGSALASDRIWRALMLTKQIKPVVVSMGDYAASGGYYISCAADSIFTEVNTLTGSIGVFGIIPNLQGFMREKLGVTTDGVKTGPYADLGNITRPMTESEKNLVQKGINQVYDTFLDRVSTGRNLDKDSVNEIAQGRIWLGKDAVARGLTDRLGGIEDATQSAAALAGLEDYSIKEFPKSKSPYELLLSNVGKDIRMHLLSKTLGEQYTIFKKMKNLSDMKGKVMARLPVKALIE